MSSLKQSKCVHGHRLTPENVYLRKNGTRECRKCSRARSKKQNEARKAARHEAA